MGHNETSLPAVRIGDPGIELHYLRIEPKRRSSSAPVVFVHGSLVDLRTWNHEFEPFSSRFQVIAYSRRFNYPNRNLWDGVPHSVRDEAHDLGGLLTRLNLGPVHLVGHSLGAYVALDLATLFPDLVASLCVSEPAILPWLGRSPAGESLYQEHQDLLWDSVRSAYVNGDGEKALRQTIDYFQGTGQWNRFAERHREIVRQNSMEWKALALSPEPFSDVSDQAVRDLHKPILLLLGGRSRPFFRQIGNHLCELNSGVKVQTIPEAAHEMWDSHPHQCRRAALAFLRDIAC